MQRRCVRVLRRIYLRLFYFSFGFEMDCSPVLVFPFCTCLALARLPVAFTRVGFLASAWATSGGSFLFVLDFLTLLIPPLLELLLELNVLEAALSLGLFDEILLCLLLGKDIGHRKLE